MSVDKIKSLSWFSNGSDPSCKKLKQTQVLTIIRVELLLRLMTFLFLTKD
jgi:hypothetical protein